MKKFKCFVKLSSMVLLSPGMGWGGNNLCKMSKVFDELFQNDVACTAIITILGTKNHQRIVDDKSTR